MRKRQPTSTRAVCLVASLLLISSSVTLAQTSFTSSTTTTRPACTTYNGCFNCVNAGCAWGIGTCFDSCDELPEMSCYSIAAHTAGSVSFTTTTTSTTATTICQKQQDDAYDAANCGTKTSCEVCTSTPLRAQLPEGQAAVQERQDLTTTTTTTTVTPTPTCSWYEDRGMCSHLQCDLMGCSSPYCPSSPQGQCYFGANNCLDCLDNVPSQFCSWSGGSCELNCLPDVNCYSPTNFPNLNNAGICQAADNFEADTKLCLGQLNCGTCTTTTKTDGTNCQWYYDAPSQTGWCGLGGCNENNLCGLTSCVGVPDTSASMNYPVCAGLESLDPEDLTCEACIAQPGCGWTTNGQCLGSCSAIADIPCYTVGSGQTIQSVCNDAAIAIADATLCASKTSRGCSECVQTLKNGRRDKCQWYSDLNFGSGTSYCGVGGCDGLGNCGQPTCSGVVDTTNAGSGAGNCKAANNCNSCLNNPPCVWGGDGCYENCNDVCCGKTCYSPLEPEFARQSTGFICAQAPAPVPGGTAGSRDVTPAQTPTSSGVAASRWNHVIAGAAATTTTLLVAATLLL